LCERKKRSEEIGLEAAVWVSDGVMGRREDGDGEEVGGMAGFIGRGLKMGGWPSVPISLIHNFRATTEMGKSKSPLKVNTSLTRLLYPSN
jgi:hypothetical protein